MSEHESNKGFPTSGNMLEERKPTVIKIAQKKQEEQKNPTVCSPIPEENRPQATVIKVEKTQVLEPIKGPTRVMLQPETQNVQPTRISIEKIEPSSSQKEGEEQILRREDTSLQNRKPSMIPGGISRKGIDTSKEELQSMFSHLSEALLLEIQRQLTSIVISTMDRMSFVEWGKKTQEQYAKLVKDMLQMEETSVFNKMLVHKNTLYTRLKSVAESFREPKGLLEKLKKQKTPWETYFEKKAEIEDICNILQNAIPALRRECSEHEKRANDFVSLIHELQKWEFCGQYLIDKKIISNEYCQDLERKIPDLIQTQSLIHQSLPLRQQKINTIIEFIDQINDAILITLPSWMEQVSHIGSKSTKTETESYETESALETLLQKLK